MAIAPGALEPVTLWARLSARYHLQLRILHRSGAGRIRGRVTRIFRGEGKLREGDEVEFDVPVDYGGTGSADFNSYGNAATPRAFRLARYIEAFLNREKGECTLAADQYAFSWFRSVRPRLRVPAEDEVAAAWERFGHPMPQVTPSDDSIEVEMAVEIRDQDGNRSSCPSHFRGWLEVMKPGDFITLRHTDGGELFVQGPAEGPFLIRCTDASGQVLAEAAGMPYSRTCRVIQKFISGDTAEVTAFLSLKLVAQD